MLPCACPPIAGSAPARAPFALILVVMISSAAAVGCRREGGPSDRSEASATPPLKIVDRVDYPIANYLPPLDEGRVRIPVPKDWIVSPRSKAYLCQFKRVRSASVLLPRIRFTVQPLSGDEWEGWRNVARERVSEFAKKIASTLNRKSLVEEVRPMVIGPHPCARYVDAVKFPVKDPAGRRRIVAAQRQVICLLHDGRLYRCELHVHPGTILDYRDAAYAVVAGLQFIEKDGEETKAASESKPPSDEARDKGSDEGEDKGGES